MTTYTRYAELRKPSWAPSPRVFGPVWSVLYLIIAVSFGAVFVQALRGAIPGVIAVPFLLNLVSNAAYTPLQFRLKSNLLATLDILVVLVTIVWGIIAVHDALLWVAYAQMPYLLWVTFATCLQITITWMNRKR